MASLAGKVKVRSITVGFLIFLLTNVVTSGIAHPMNVAAAPIQQYNGFGMLIKRRKFGTKTP